MTGKAGNNQRKRLPVGVSDFKDVVTGGYYYVDKTLFIKDVIDKGDKILLIPRPRRFGKTLNLSMLKYFYDCCPDPEDPDSDAESTSSRGNERLFDSLAIGRAGEEYMNKQGKYPVIFLSFRDIKEEDWEIAYRKIIKLIRGEYRKHDYLLQSPRLKPSDKEYFQMIVDLKGEIEDYETSLGSLLVFLRRHYRERGVILIDEYDAPIHAGFSFDYYDRIVLFMRNFLSGGLKDTDQYLEKSVLTGIMRIAKESIFSGLNNPGVYTLLSDSFNDKFGFTDEEVEYLLREFNVSDRFNYVREWYNGYRFGGKVIYNPWSIINYLAEGAKKFKPYWVNTSDNVLVESLLSSGGKELKEELELLISGETIEKNIDDNIVLKHIDSYENSLWSFLLMGGYLKPTAERMGPTSDKMFYTLAIPNREVKTIYRTIIERYFTSKIENKKLEIMLKALIDGDVKLFERMLRKVVAAVFSFHDFGGEPEKVYHALVAGLLVWISDTHEVKSNRESGYGRYDIMIIPKDIAQTGYVIEFKTVDEEENETVSDAIETALKQIDDRKYESELMERGIKHYKKLAIAFKGKDVTVKEARH
ncbi:MAG: AAA family ATPase [bacterium]|nr:AAA family ATPase [bacterium]